MDAGIDRVIMFFNTDRVREQYRYLGVDKNDALVSICSPDRRKTRIDAWMQLVFGRYVRYACDWDDVLLRQLCKLPVQTASTVMRREHIARLDSLKKKPLPSELARRLNRPWQSSSWGSMCDSEMGNLDPVLTNWAEAHRDAEDGSGGDAVGLWRLNTGWSAEVGEETVVARMWRDIIREPVIPYSVTARKSKLAHAFQTLAPHVERHEALVARDGTRG